MDLDRDFSFKGKRKYLHSTTLFDDILTLRDGHATNIDFKFNKKTNHQVHYQSTPPEDDSLLVAVWHDSKSDIHVIEREARIEHSKPYDEDALSASFSYDGNQVTVPSDISIHSPIEAVVAGFKTLLKKIIAGQDAKLAFVRLRLEKVPATPLNIRYTRRIGDFYQGEVFAGEKKLGQIFFGEWQ